MVAGLLLCLVVGIADGDTITARCADSAGGYERMQVRVQGIDAPEKKQPFGTRARQALSDLTFNQWADLHCNKTDRYGRKVCSVWVAPSSAPDGPRTLDAGLAMVSTGMAWWYRAYAREQSPQERGQYEFAEEEARSLRTGLWADTDATPPWIWRRSNQTKQSTSKEK
ncbi:thermonuclease family protein [Acidovorax sp. GBBC 3334]|uniref:thermonuclease family protein n=1 Tax=Acidovorax sp. GBBC 3334 TaxID=2940496 RepID=UPI002302F0B7|nr:thermonuclease family protein [Acidovorax sp. GBBC 3334]MDA8455275.1 thermonuclease family protein [Acidovorax sp. GBBC 3334]